jgi:hypothetical protein
VININYLCFKQLSQKYRLSLRKEVAIRQPLSD